MKRPILPIPVKVRRDFLRRLGYRGNARLLAVLWHKPKECVLLFDGVSYKRANNDRPFVDLCEQLVEWLKERKIRLRPARSVSFHWLLVDLTTGEAFVAPVRVGRQAVIDQKFPEEIEGKQKRLPF